MRLFSTLPEAVIRDLESNLTITDHCAGSILFRQDQKAKGMFVLFSGRVKLTAIVAGGRTALLKIAAPGQILGLAAVLSSRCQITTAEVMTSSLIGFVGANGIASLMRKHPQLSEALARHLASTCIKAMSETLFLRVPTSNSQRLAAMLLRVAESHKHSQASGHDSFGYTHAELGQLIGASRETITRLLGKFERKGLLIPNGSGTADLELLRELADGG
ncbi:MAG TPA: Crp/Fnr family transcriptional regulator [Terriglobales bacterium]|nr:Crp/Fnr family transcriptional regulator [Terriglobales bacterium]